MYDQRLGVQPDVVEAHMWLTAPTRTWTPRHLRKILDAFLTKPQDRVLFDLPPRPKDA